MRCIFPTYLNDVSLPHWPKHVWAHMMLVLTLSHDAGDTGEVGTLIWHRPGTQNALSLSLSFSHSRSLFLCMCVCVYACLCVWRWEELSPTAVVTQLCLVYISSDNSGSKHRSPYADVPLIAFKHVCGSACLYVWRWIVALVRICVFLSLFFIHVANVSLNIHPSFQAACPSFSGVFVITSLSEVPKGSCWNRAFLHVTHHYWQLAEFFLSKICMFVPLDFR